MHLAKRLVLLAAHEDHEEQSVAVLRLPRALAKHVSLMLSIRHIGWPCPRYKPLPMCTQWTI